MNVLFMIGNGFDKNLGLNTAYSDFYEYYINLPSSNENISKFKEEIKNKNYCDWADLEVALGKYSINFDNEDDYIDVIDDVTKNLKKYLEIEQESYGCEISLDQIKEEFLNCYKYLSNANQEKYKSFVKKEENINVNIISFNYTNTLERILNRKTPVQLSNRNIKGKIYYSYIQKIIHIHGTLTDSMILGVNDYTQICNENLRTTKVQDYIVKPYMNMNAETLREYDCEKLIAEANIIIIYGMSIGETDKHWWEKLMSLYSQDPSVLILLINYDKDYNETFKQHFVQKKRDMRNRLLKYVINNDSQLSDNELKTVIEHRILVEFNTNMFRFDLIKIKEAA